MTTSQLANIWNWCIVTDGIPTHPNLQAVKDFWMMGYTSDVIYVLNMISSDNVPFVTCLVDGLKRL